MRIACTYKDNNIFAHFGHTEEFLIVDVENNQIIKQEVISTNGSGHTALAGLLAKLNVNTLICGGIGGGAIKALEANNIKVCGGVSGNALEAVEKLLNNTLVSSSEANCDHHDHEHGGGHECSCGSHDDKCDSSSHKKLTRM